MQWRWRCGTARAAQQHSREQGGPVVGAATIGGGFGNQYYPNMVAELEPLSASCNVTKIGPEGINWPRGFFVMQKGAGDEVIADVEDREGQLSIHDSQVREIVSLSRYRFCGLSYSRSL